MANVIAVLLMLVAAKCCILEVNSQVYYIYPVNDTCSMDGATLEPCYHLHQLNETLLSSRDSVTLLFLPGKHVIHDEFRAFDVQHFTISSLDEQQVTIECETEQHLYFEDINHLEVRSLTLNSCPLIKHTDDQRMSQFDDSEHKSSSFVNSTFTGLLYESFILSIESVENVSIINCTFENYTIYGLGAVWISLSFHSFAELSETLTVYNSRFINITVLAKEVERPTAVTGLLKAFKAYMDINNSRFINNNITAPGSGVVCAVYCKFIVRKCLFVENHALLYGAINSQNSQFAVADSYFKNNSAGKFGGAIYATNILVWKFTHVIFEDNYAKESGGAVYLEGSRVTLERAVKDITDCRFVNNSAGKFGGALLFTQPKFKDEYVFIITNTSFAFNRASFGGALYCDRLHGDNSAVIVTNSHSMSNSAKRGGFAYLQNSFLQFEGETNVENNTAECNGGAVYAVESMITLSHTVLNITYNTAGESGGALYLNQSYVRIHSNEVVTFAHNSLTSPEGKGGAMYVLDNNCEHITLQSKYQCFLKYDFTYGVTVVIPHFISANNQATSGSLLYGGLLDRCRMRMFPTQVRDRGIDFFKRQVVNEISPLAITSDPMKICFDDGSPHCNTREINATRMRGQTIQLRLVSVGQNENPVPSVITASYQQTSAQLDKGEGKLKIPGEYSTQGYHIYTASSTATLVLEPEGPCRSSLLSIFTVHVTLRPCARGFEQENDRCVCDRRLNGYFGDVFCDIDTQAIQRKRAFWLGYDREFLKMNKNCPLDYCQVLSDSISLLSPDEQCANHRSGVICGGCQHNYSIALGGSKCLHCTSNYTSIWLTVVFAVAGLALVALLLVYNMTISAGTLNGLIFYANVVSISGLTSLHNCSIHPTLSVFIAWVNLDLGVETCFYSGMDTYQKTWLQFAFPLYIWLLVTAIIVASYYSSTAMRVFGRNNIAILATLFILSYTKILKTIITALSVTQVIRSDADDVTAQLTHYKVWTYDGNIEYLKGKHVALFAVALSLLLFLFLPYTLLLIFGQCVRSMSVRRCRWVLRWIHSTAFVSIMDAYHAPYNKKHRYWTGLMLLTRCFLLLAFATNASDNALLTNMFAIVLVIAGILTVKTFTTNIYRHFYIGVLELAFLLNLGLLSATLYYLRGKDSDDASICKTVTASFSISFVLFFGILAYHFFLRISETRCYIPLRQSLLNKVFRKQHAEEAPAVRTYPTTTSVELREELLSD